jgi:hypothetical protein
MVLQAANRAFPNESHTQTRYKDIYALLLRWEKDEMNVDWELDSLQKVFMNYGFDTEKWLIPSQYSHLMLNNKVSALVQKYNDQDSLVIIYYAGHGFINDSRQATWTW